MSYAEAIVTFREDTDPSRVQAWFEQQGFQTLPMKMGLLITGSEELFRGVFNAPADEISARAIRDVALDVPTAIANSVDSITIRRLPLVHD